MKTLRAVAGVAVLLTSCCGRSWGQRLSCPELSHVTLASAAMGLPTTGAAVRSARLRHEGGVAFCKVLGRIRPIDPKADDIRFEVNLPEAWNGKAVHFGGGTFDGYLGSANGLGRGAIGLASLPTPLERGYATFGSDSGHHRRYFPFPDAVNSLNARFARNDEMRHNFDGDALKKVHDVAVALMLQRYGRRPQRMFFLGGSTGGREALRVVQRYPDDYDGVLAAYAAWDQIELDLQFMRTAQALYAPGGFLHRAQVHFIQKRVEQSCDAQDGLRDKIISNPDGCHVKTEDLLCTAAHHPHGCLQEAQRHTLEVFATPQRTEMALDHGVDSISGYNVLSGAELGAAVGLLPFALRNPVVLLNSFGYVIGDDVTRNFLTVGRHYNSLHFDTKTGGRWQAELLQQSRDIDSSDADIRPFASHGGKLLLVHGTTDTVIPTNSSVDYYERVRSAIGEEATGKAVRLYLIPGLGHGYGRFNGGFDALGTLDAWADKGIAPLNLTVTDNHGGRTRPMCEWPAYAKLAEVNGDTNSAMSFRCVLPAGR